MWKPRSLIRQCPRCGSFDIHRHRGKSLKRSLLRLVFVRQFACLNCNSLYYGFLFSKRKEGLNGRNREWTAPTSLKA